jgi:hypothetical protein
VLTRRETINIGNSVAWLARLRRLLGPLAAGRRVQKRDRTRWRVLLGEFFDLWDGLDQSTHDALYEAARAFADALDRSDGAVVEAAKTLDNLAAHWEQLLRRWQAREPMIDGDLTPKPRKVEGPRENLMRLCGLLRLVWDAYADGAIRTSRAKRRKFVAAVLSAASIPRPDENDYQTLDDWIETDVTPARSATVPKS